MALKKGKVSGKGTEIFVFQCVLKKNVKNLSLKQKWPCCMGSLDKLSSTVGNLHLSGNKGKFKITVSELCPLPGIPKQHNISETAASCR